jgi:AmmeMemoRadiSam system protein A
MLSTDVRLNDGELSPADRETLLDIAQLSVRSGFHTGQPFAIDPTSFAAALRTCGASFVTLHIGAELRGCVGSVKVRRPLVVDVAENAFNAAFQDPRFSPLRPSEFAVLTIHVSVLSPMEQINAASEADLLEQIRPGTDGLELECGPYRGLLLPSVWENLPDKRQFLQVLKRKAGLRRSFWSQQMNVYRFTTESFGRKVSSRHGNHAA